MVTIREKFSKFSTKLLVITMLTIVALGTSLGVNGYRTTVQQIKINNHANLLSKGRTLVKNNSQAMSGMAEDNAFIAIRELVSSTEREDKDIAYGIFMDSQRRPWAFAHSDTLDSLTEQPLDDSLSIWAAGLEMSGWREIDLDGTQIFEFAAPVVSESLRLGTIRYGMTTAGMQEAISEAKRAAFGKSLAYPITFLVIGFILFFFQNRASRRQADAITTPLQHLTKAAEGIAAGDYLSPITTESNDEGWHDY